MSWRRLLAKLGPLFRRPKPVNDLEEEIRSHLRMEEQENLESGMPPDEAHYAALRRFGNVTLAQERSREMWGWNSVETLWQDLRYGLRMLAKNPGFTAVAVLTLALGIGANTAIFSLIDAVLLKMLPVRDAEQLVQVTWTDPHGRPDETFSYPAYEEFRDHNEVFSGVFAFASLDRVNVGVNGEGQLADGQVVSGNYYRELGVDAVVGRTISPEDDKVVGASPVAVISYDYWRRRFNLDLSVVGKKLTLNGFPFTIIGVTPPEFFGLQAGNSVDVSIPTKMLAQVKPEWGTVGNRSIFKADDNWWLEIMARTKAGVTERRALADLETLFERVKRASLGPGSSDVPQLDQEILNTRIKIEPASRGLSALRQQFSKPLLVLMAVVGLVLLIACANVANLLLARATTRRKEFAMRLALGAGRLRLVRQLMTESLLLALCGGALGLLLAFWGTRLLLTLLSGSPHPILLKVDPHVRVLGFTALVSSLTGILFGLAPALRGTQLDLTPGLKGSISNLGSGGRLPGLGRALVSLQVGVSLVLLISAGLFVRSLQKLKNLYPGFNPEKVLVVSLDPSLVGYKGVQAINLYKNLLDRVRAIPGVRGASLSEYSPMTSEMTGQIVAVQGYTPRSDEDIAVHQNNVGPGYFKTLGIPVLLGREFGDADAAGAPGVAVINQTMARYYFGNQNPIGKRFGLGGPETAGSLEIVGMVQDAKYNDLREQTPRLAYIPFLQSGAGRMTFEIRTATDPSSVVAPFREAVRTTDKNIPVFNIRTLTQQVDESLVQERLVATLSGLFGLLALLVACIGLYGIMSYTVVRRTNEIGIRMALGAKPRGVVWMVMGEMLALVAVGIGIGLPSALAAIRLISSMLFGLSPTDPLTIAAAVLLLAGVAALAGYLPARRASHVDPMVALRYE